MTTAERLAYRMNDAARRIDLSRDSLERLIAAGLIRSYKVGSARFVSATELERFVREREQAGT